MPEPAALLDRLRRRDRLALSRLLSLIARGEYVAEIGSALDPAVKPARVVAITGSAGVGKSTLIGKLLEHVRKQGLKVAVLACDPQSPISGGALLGDRFRMSSAEDDGIFIRSLAALSGHGAVAEHLPLMARLLSTFGFDVILIETVGAGQGDVTVAGLADVVVLLLQPETGDDLQWEKAGVLEVADVIGVQKADLPRAEQVAAQVRAVLELGDKKPTPVVLVSARTGQGLAELWQRISEVAPRQHHGDVAAEGLLHLLQERIAARFTALTAAHDPVIEQVVRAWRSGSISSGAAAESLLRRLAP